MFRLIAGLAAAFVTAILPWPSEAQTVPFTRDAIAFEVSLDSKGGLFIAAMLREAKGMVVVCGATWLSEASGLVRHLRSKAEANMALVLDGKTLPVSPTDFAHYDSREEAVSGGAKCLGTSRAWKPDYANAKLEIRTRYSGIRD